MFPLGTREENDTVREHIPLEQGLRLPYSQTHRETPLCVREHIPLEQGLRQHSS